MSCGRAGRLNDLAGNGEQSHYISITRYAEGQWVTVVHLRKRQECIRVPHPNRKMMLYIQNMTLMMLPFGFQLYDLVLCTRQPFV